MLKRLKKLVTIVQVFKPLRTLIRRRQMTPYPTTLPLDCLTTVAEILKTRTVQTRKQEFGLCAWNVQGFIQRMTLGDPVMSNVSPEQSEATYTDEQINELFGCCDNYVDYELNNFSATPEDAVNMDPATIIAIVSAIMQLIEMLRNKRNS